MRARWVAILCLLAVTARAETRRLTIDEALKMALESNPRLRATRARADAAHRQADSARGRYLPSINFSNDYQQYTGPFSVGFGGQSFVVREDKTDALGIAITQPFFGLLEINQNHLSAIDQALAWDEQVKATEATLREEVQTQLLRLFEARATQEIARTSQEQLGEQLSVAKAKLEAGVLTNADVLRVVVAVANARQQEIQAQAQEQASRAALLADLNLSQTDTSVDFEEPTALENAEPPPELAEALAQADRQRPEIAQARFLESSAKHVAWSKAFRFLPTLDLSVAYSRVTGQTFAQQEAVYAEARASWNLWSWGADFYAQRAAAAQEVAAAEDTLNTRQQIGMDLSARLSQERAATTAVDVARTAIESAEEAFRVTQVLVKVGSATTTDLLDSQSALTQAKLNLVRARYQQAIARVAVKRALGG